MSKTNQARVPRRRREGGGVAWVRPFRRLLRGLDASARLIESTRRVVARSQRCAHRRPVRATAELMEASTRLQDASARLVWAAEELEVTNACLVRDPGPTGAVREALNREAERCVAIMASLEQTAGALFSLQDHLMLGLEAGVLVPERPASARPRIQLAPRPVPIRAFLLLRQPRVIDRIAPILRRRRQTPRPASIRVPRRTLLDRAPPLFPISLR